MFLCPPLSPLTSDPHPPLDFSHVQKLDSLPNCVFDASGPLREYSLAHRGGALLAKGAELSAIGWFTGAATSLLTSAAVSLHQRTDPSYQPSVEAPGLGSSAGGLAAYFALNANARCVCVCVKGS